MVSDSAGGMTVGVAVYVVLVPAVFTMGGTVALDCDCSIVMGVIPPARKLFTANTSGVVPSVSNIYVLDV